MTKAQAVRNKRLKRHNKEIKEEAKKIFDWILDIMDDQTNRGHFSAVKVYLWYGQSTIKTDQASKEYDLADVLLKFDRVKLFSNLKEIIEEEKGYTADLETDTSMWDVKAITLVVNIVM